MSPQHARSATAPVAVGAAGAAGASTLGPPAPTGGPDVAVVGTPDPPAPNPPAPNPPALSPSGTGPSVTGSSATVGSLAVIAGTVASGALNYAYVLALTHLLRRAGYTDFAGAQAVLLVVGTVANSAVPWVLAREVRAASGPAGRRAALSAGLVANAVLGTVAAAFAAALAAPFLPAAGVLAVAVSALGFFVASTGMGWAQGVGRFGLLGVLVGGEVAVKVVAGVVSVRAGAGVTGAVAAAAVGTLAVVVVAGAAMGGDRGWSRPGPLRRMGRASLGMAGLQGLMTAVAVADVVAASLLRHGTALAPYQLAATVGRVPVFLAFAVATTVFPAIGAAPAGPAAARRRAAGRRSDGATVGAAAGLLVTLSAVAWAVAATVPAPLMRVVSPAYVASLRFLPLTAANGAGWAAVILLCVCLRAAGATTPVVGVLLASLAAAVVVLPVAYRLDGAWGLGIGEAALAAGSLVAVGVVAVGTWGGAWLRRSAARLPVAAVVVPLVVAKHHPAAWSAAVALVAAGGAALVRRGARR